MALRERPHDQQEIMRRRLLESIKSCLDELDAMEDAHRTSRRSRNEGLNDEDEAEEEDVPPRVFAGSLYRQEDLQSQLDQRIIELSQLKNRLAEAQRREAVIKAKDESLQLLHRVARVIEDAGVSAGRPIRPPTS